MVTWEIAENDSEVVNLTEGQSGFEKTMGYTLEQNDDGKLELHSVDGATILEKYSDDSNIEIVDELL